ncbi:lantibiotic dehydratase [Mucilaginibacter aquaedulcis]|uniref:lantibiotic dehydratase n=1 Tax=Mucilaginibacter aquaedulcis TaxID=1187081 RepID=UPI0025B300F6|nr:lantibiotic dehydratase [Mucilaginibacter aquaedulcis]MDN3548912.1 lantibiotic dehydratase [Mucilaginibacter aquaedulcis]
MVDIEDYIFLPEVFLRASFYSFARYDFARLAAVLSEQIFRNAIFLASPEFYRQLEARGFDWEQLTDRERHTLYKYYNRMCFRPTPFGSFASFTIAKWADSDIVCLQDDEHSNLYLQPSNEFSDAGNIKQLRQDQDRILVANPTLYRFGREFRLIRSTPDDKGKYRFDVVSLEAELFYVRIVALFKKKRLSARDLCSWIEKFFGCSETEATEHIGFLLEAQLILGPETLQIMDHHAGRRHLLSGDQLLWSQLEKRSPGRIGSLAGWASLLKKADHAREPLPVQPFYAALERPLKSGGADTGDQQALREALKVLRKLALPVKQTALKTFIRAFRDRFDRRKVPLLEALDPDSGINYGDLMGGFTESHALNGIRFPEKTEGEAALRWTAVHQLLFQVWKGGTKEHYAPLELTPEHLAGLADPGYAADMPPTLAIMYRKSEEFLIVENAGGASGTSLIGRFSLFGDDAWEFAKSLAAKEQEYHPDIAFADILQLSDLHTDNINRRRKIYPYGIPVNTYPGAWDDSQLNLNDLYLSVIEEELVLESVRLRKRVIPRLATAYNFQHNPLGIFRLLCDLQYQGLHAALSLDLEQFFPGMDFYPRVCAGHVILSNARWKFTRAALQSLEDDGQGDISARFRAFRKKYQLPQRISVGAGDQQLVFDLLDRRECEFLLRQIAGSKTLTVQEYLLPDRSVRTGNKPVAGQMIAFLSHSRTIYNSLKGRNTAKKGTKIPRYFFPGDEWLYVKLFCTPESSDQLLSGLIREFLHKNKGGINQWFFIRYQENGYHLRLRFMVEDGHAGSLLINLKNELRQGTYRELVKAFQVDSYHRELERYGTDLIGQVERYFEASSNLVLELGTGNEGVPLSEFQAAFWVTYHLLVVFLPVESERSGFLSQVTTGFFSEFGGAKLLKVDMDARFRVLRTDLVAAMELPGSSVGLNQACIQELEKLLTVARIITNAAEAKTSIEKTGLFADLIHMHLNRAFRDHPREQEFLVYHCLQKHLISERARK